MIRIGLVGCGHIGKVHSFALRQLADADLVAARLVATYDDDHSRAKELARHHAEQHAFGLALHAFHCRVGPLGE